MSQEAVPLTKKQRKKLLKKQAAEESKKQGFRNYLQREQQFTAKSRAILDKSWAEICGNILQQDLLKSIGCLRENLDRTLDEKEKGIETLMGYLDQAEVQYKRRLDSHIGILEGFLKIHKFFTDILRNHYESDCMTMLVTFNEERDKTETVLSQQKAYYEQLRHAENQFLVEKHENIDSNFQNQKLDLEWTHITKQYFFEEKMFERIHGLMDQIKNEIRKYKKEAITKKHAAACQKMAKSLKISMDRFRQMEIEAQRAQRRKQDLQTQLTDIELWETRKTQQLKRQIIDLEMVVFAKKKIYKEISDFDAENLAVMAVSATRALNSIEKTLKYVSLLGKLSATCSKMEKPGEKLFLLDPCDLLGKFWHKVTHVEYERNVLRAEKEHLLAENERLRRLAREYCIQNRVQSNIQFLVNAPKPLVGIPAQTASQIPQIRSVLKARRRK